MTEEEFETELKQILEKYNVTTVYAVTFGFSMSSSNYPFLEGVNIDSLPSKAQIEIKELIERFVKSSS